MKTSDRAALRTRATKLENEAIEAAESFCDCRNTPKEALATCAYAELKLKAAAALRSRARDLE